MTKMKQRKHSECMHTSSLTVLYMTCGSLCKQAVHLQTLFLRTELTLYSYRVKVGENVQKLKKMVNKMYKQEVIHPSSYTTPYELGMKFSKFCNHFALPT